jgi:hypothetical protein
MPASLPKFLILFEAVMCYLQCPLMAEYSRSVSPAQDRMRFAPGRNGEATRQAKSNSIRPTAVAGTQASS